MWDKLEPEQAVEGFSHVFLLRARGDWTLGRLWSSRDGKGRARYPMVLACHIAGAPLEWALKEVLPELAALQTLCESTAQASEVVAGVDVARRTLRGRFAQVPEGQPDITEVPSVAPELADDPALGPARLGMHRVLYQIDRELADFAIGPAAPGKTGPPPRAQQFRVPPCGSDPGGVLLRWARFLLLKLDSGVPMMMLLPTARPWLDVIVGEPAGSQLFCLRATPRSIPLTTDIPYTLDAAFVAGADGWIDSCRGRPTSEVRTPAKGRRAAEAGKFW